MDRTELMKLASDTFSQCLQTMDRKNQDYAGITGDALKNFKVVEFFNLVDAPTGIMVRLSDKFIRICNLLNAEAAVNDEAIEDTIDDMINYLVLVKAALKDKIK